MTGVCEVTFPEVLLISVGLLGKVGTGRESQCFLNMFVPGSLVFACSLAETMVQGRCLYAFCLSDHRRNARLIFVRSNLTSGEKYPT